MIQFTKFFCTSTLFFLSLLVFSGIPRSSHAKPQIKRRGGQAEVFFGGSFCIPGVAKCRSSTDVVGSTGPSLGMGALIGYRPISQFLIGAAYNVGFFNPAYRNPEQGSLDLYRIAYQHSVFAVLRGILPIWRFDLGLELAPGWSRQVFKGQDNAPPRVIPTAGVVTVNKEFSQGFALKTAPVIDFYVTRQFFLGARVDFIFNFHNQVCYDYADSNERLCVKKSDENQASVHQILVGLHVGGTF